MKLLHFDVTLTPTEWRDGRTRYKYTVITPTGVTFTGSDYSGPFGQPPRRAALALLGFITARPGDTDDNYFADYTPEQMAWANSIECEWSASEVSNAENRKSTK